MEYTFKVTVVADPLLAAAFTLDHPLNGDSVGNRDDRSTVGLALAKIIEDNGTQAGLQPRAVEMI